MRPTYRILPCLPSQWEDAFMLVQKMHMEVGDLVLEDTDEDKKAFQFWFNSLLLSGGISLVALDSFDVPVGIINFTVMGRPYKGPKYGFTMHLYVEPDFRKTRLAHDLSSGAQYLVERTGVKDLEFLTIPKKSAIDKWKKRGWKAKYVVMTKEI